MGRDEVLEHRQAFPEIGRDGGLDDLAGRFGHQAPHAAQLPDLLRTPACTRIRHHENGVKDPLGPRVAASPDFLHHLVGDLLGHMRPDIDDLVVPLAIGDESFGVLLFDLVDLPLSLGD